MCHHNYAEDTEEFKVLATQKAKSVMGTGLFVFKIKNWACVVPPFAKLEIPCTDMYMCAPSKILTYTICMHCTCDIKL